MKVLLRVVLVLSLVVLVIPFSVSNSVLADMPKDMGIDDAIVDVNPNDMDVIVLGDNTDNDLSQIQLQENKKINSNKVDSLDKIDSNKKYKTLWISKEYQANLLKKDGVEKLDKLLDKGYSIYFLDLPDINILHQLFTDNQSYEQPTESEYTPKVNFVTKNKDGEYFFGTVWMDKENVNNVKELHKILVASAWNRKNDKNYTRKAHDLRSQNIANADAGSTFTIGSKWKNVRAWAQNIYFTDYGSLVEWRAGYYLTDPVDGKDYYAVAFDSGMSPKQNCTDGFFSNYCASDTLTYWSDADANSQANKLRMYEPKAIPSTTTVEYSIGGALSKSGGAEGSIGASYSFSKSDLEIIDQSDLLGQKAQIKFNYKYSSILGNPPAYAKGTSWQNVAIVYQGKDGAPYVNFDTGRNASFYKGNTGFKNIQASSVLVLTKS